MPSDDDWLRHAVGVRGCSGGGEACRISLSALPGRTLARGNTAH